MYFSRMEMRQLNKVAVKIVESAGGALPRLAMTTINFDFYKEKYNITRYI
jgi:hypothetical protein